LPYTAIYKIDGATQDLSSTYLDGIFVDNLGDSAIVGDWLFFIGSGDDIGLYKMNMGSGECALVTDLSNYWAAQPVAAGGKVFFADGDGTSTGQELFMTEAATGEVRLVADISEGSGSSDPWDLVAIGEDVYFTAEARDGSQAIGRELYRFDGAQSQVSLVADFNPGEGSSAPEEVTEFDGKIFSTAADGVHGRQLVMYDPISHAVATFADVLPAGAHGEVHIVGAGASKLYVSAPDEVGDGALWAFDGQHLDQIDLDPSLWNYDVGGLWSL
jgi:ELWxxDGT repeat protein